MLTLALDTSTPAVSVGLADIDANGGIDVLAEKVIVNPRAHAEQLAPLVQEALATQSAKPTQLAAIVAGVGPGPFTGLRVGLVTAASMGHALGIPTYAVCSLDAIGHAASVGDEAAPVLVATDARRKEIYWATYDADGRRVTGPHVDKPAMLPEAAAHAARMVGDGAQLYSSQLSAALSHDWRYPPVSGLFALAADRVVAGRESETLTPMYLRRPDVHVAGKTADDRRLPTQTQT